MYQSYEDEWTDALDTPPENAIGLSKSHTSRFREFRSEKLDSYNTDINKLVIRLERLINGLTADPVKRKSHEQSVVPWMDDTLVSLCPTCGGSFNITKRKHHCRLCGAIACSRCCHFLSLNDALNLTNIRQDSGRDQTTLPDIRMCMPCSERLEHKRQKVASKSARPIICQFYEKLQVLQSDANNLLIEYHKMHRSLCSGESVFDLRDAQMTRLKIVQLAEQIEQTSKSILILGTKSSTESTPRGRTLRLQQSIRGSASNFIRDKLMCLPSLPSEMELKEVQDRLQKGLSNRMNQQSKGLKGAHVMQGAGWGTYTASANVVETDNPIIQQINIVKGYVKQAREAGKLDELRMLEENLKMLEATFWEQQGQ